MAFFPAMCTSSGLTIEFTSQSRSRNHGDSDDLQTRIGTVHVPKDSCLDEAKEIELFT